MKLSLAAIVLFLMACIVDTGHAETAKLIIGTNILDVELANTRDKILTGMSNKKRIKEDEGMLYVYPFKDMHCIKMDKTNIPLSLAFIDDDFKVFETANMTPNTTIKYCASKPIRYALQTKIAYFDSNKISHNAQIIFVKGKDDEKL